LHGYIDSDPTPTHRADLEAFLAAHPLIAERVEMYRSHIVAVNAAFGAGDESLPPALAQLASRYARAVAVSSVIGTTLVGLGTIVILCVIAGAAHGG
jgi:anti-sigma factor RsiW